MNRLILPALFLCGLSGFAQDKPKPKPAGPFTEARKLWLRGNTEEARAAYAKLSADPKTADGAALGIARTWVAEGNTDKALSTISDAIRKSPKSADLLAFRAELKFESGQWDDAKKDADDAIAINADHFLGRWVRARLMRDRGELEKVDAEMRWFVRTYTKRDNDDKPIEDPDELYLVGQAGSENARWHALGDQFKFIINELYPDALKFDPDFWPAEHAIGLLLLEKYNRPEAMQAFENALKINPKAAEAIVGQGLVSIQQYELKDAETYADRALKINPRLPDALRLKADVLIMGGDIAGAMKALAIARDANPKDEATLARVAACQRLLKQDAAFNQTIAEAEKITKTPARFYLDLASTIEDRKLYAEAEVYFKKAVAFGEKFPATNAGLAMLYLRLGKEEESRPLLEKSFKNDRFNVRVSNSLKVLRHLEKYETIKTEHYDLRFDPATDKLLALELADYLEETHAELKKDFGYEPDGRILIELFNNHEMFSGRTVALPDLHTIGACTGRVVTMASPKGKGITRPFNWGRVIRHELVHIFNLAQTEFQCPHWMTEGLAVRKEGGNRPPNWLVALRDRYEKKDLLNLDNILLAFVRPRSPEEWSLAYCQSNLYVEYLIKTHGIESLGPMLNAFRDGLDTGTALKRVCKVEKAEFEKGYYEYVTQFLKAIPSGGRKEPEKPMTLAELEKAREADKDDIEIAARLADQYARRKKAADSRKLVDEVLQKKPGHPLASMVKARLLSFAGDSDVAREVLEAALKANPDDPRLLTGIARQLLEAKDYSRVAELLEHGRKVAPIDGDWLPMLIEVYTKNEDAAKLESVLREHIANDPDDLKSRITLAGMLNANKNFADAATVARDATRIDVTDKEAQTVLLEALDGLKKTKEAEKLRERFQK
jgi:cellulose synthase operon protein C